MTNAFDFPGFVPAYIRPLVLPRRRPVPLGRTQQAIRKTSRKHRRESP